MTVKIYSNAFARVTHQITDTTGMNHQFRYHVASFDLSTGNFTSASHFTNIDSMVQSHMNTIKEFYPSTTTIQPGIVETPPSASGGAVYLRTSGIAVTGTGPSTSNIRTAQEAVFTFKDNLNRNVRFVLLDPTAWQYGRYAYNNVSTPYSDFFTEFNDHNMLGFLGGSIARAMNVIMGHNRRLRRHYKLGG